MRNTDAYISLTPVVHGKEFEFNYILWLLKDYKTLIIKTSKMKIIITTF